MKYALSILCMALLMPASTACGDGQTARMRDLPGRAATVNGWDTFLPDSGVVGDSITAIRLGEVYITYVFGRGILELQRPLEATLEDGHWRVAGTLPPDHLGGVAVVRISRDDGRVLQIVHGL